MAVSPGEHGEDPVAGHDQQHGPVAVVGGVLGDAREGVRTIEAGASGARRGWITARPGACRRYAARDDDATRPGGRDRGPSLSSRAWGASPTPRSLSSPTARSTRERLGAALAASRGAPARATRSRPSAARSRDDPRVLRIADGRFASVAQALSGVELATVVTGDEVAAGEVDVEPDLAPLALLDIGPSLPLPGGDRRRATSVRRDHRGPARCAASALGRGPAPDARPGDEAALVAAVGERLARAPARPARAGAADHPPRHRGGRRRGAVAGRAAHRRPAASASSSAEAGLRDPPRLGRARGHRVVEPHRGGGRRARERRRRPARGRAHRRGRRSRRRACSRCCAVTCPSACRRARRHLRADPRPGGALRRRRSTLLRAAFPQGDPEDWYEASLIAYRHGDEVSARRWAESGLAHAGGPDRAEVAECLADIGRRPRRPGGVPAARAAVARRRRRRGPLDEDGAERIAAGDHGPAPLLPDRGAGRGDPVARCPPTRSAPLLGALADAGDAGREACLAFVGDPAAGPRPGRRRGRRAARPRRASRRSPGSPTRAPPPRGRPRPSTPPTSSRW